MSDIRFNRWLHQSGTGGIYQDGSGRVGIGSSTPNETLSVVGDASITGTLSFGTDASTSLSAANTFTIETGGTERLRITGIGSVGIGTDNPSGILEVLGGNGNQLHLDNAGERFTQISLQHSGAQNGALWLDDTESMVDLYANTSHGIRFKTGGDNERLRITSAGKLLLPTGSPGIQFGSPDDPALSGGINISSQTLDDYEEGAWSAVLNYHTDNTNTSGYQSSGTNGTIEANEAVYTKIGRMVYINCTFSTASTANYVYKAVSGLPFTSTSRSNLNIYVRGGVYRYSSGADEDGFFTGIISASSTFINLNSERTDTTSSGWIQARTADQVLSVSGCYLAS